MNKLKFIVFLFIAVGNSVNAQIPANTSDIPPPLTRIGYKSTYYNVSVNYDTPWTKIPATIDREGKLLIGFTDNTDHSSYVIKIATDVPKSQLSDVDFYDNVRNQMLDANASNKLLEEKDVSFHGNTYHVQVFLMQTKWGLLKSYYYGYRTGKEYYGVQISFPASESEAKTIYWPEKVIELDKGVLIDGK